MFIFRAERSEARDDNDNGKIRAANESSTLKMNIIVISLNEKSLFQRQ